ncbi:MAG: hypothetical protein P0Y53_05030 [Candidatus Pseudobacter hemicellulosilyticus]|uniref:DUF4890 domain-containing protein n=1 Tax=Candidatus Pseudobacter hemicellulosilyticus TaxID=3121375 RepID=A0AAJ6BIG9_9BACT|nr:MAG: hypothetical protein P0Y53_05030 [Pseudobacter sp.]
MKKYMLLALTVIFAGIFSSQAQGRGGFQPRSVEENVKLVKEKLAVLKLDAAQTTQSDTIFTHYFKDRQKMMQDMQGGSGDRTQAREKFQQLNEQRDEKLKKVFTDDQYKKWKDEVEPSLRPQRPGGGGGGRPGGGGNR